jgi:hypothetical protein
MLSTAAAIHVLVLATGFVMQDKADSPATEKQAIKQAERKIARELDKETNIEFIDVPLTDMCKYLTDLHGIKLELDAKGFKKAGINPGTPITTKLKGITLRRALDVLLGDLKLRYEVRDGVLLITPRGPKVQGKPAKPAAKTR